MAGVETIIRSDASARRAPSNPIVSFIHFCRNDDYAGGIAEKLCHSIAVLTHQLIVRGLEAEILVVDWNPPLDRAPLYRVLAEQAGRFNGADIRVISIAPRYHYLYPNSQFTPMNIPAAVNVALRRARGGFCVVRAADVYYSEKLMDFIASGDYSPAAVYRCIRRDIQPDIELFYRSNVNDAIKLLATNSSKEIAHEHLANPVYPPLANLYTNASGDFMFASTRSFRNVRGLSEKQGAISLDHDGLLLNCLVASGLKQVILPSDACVYKLTHVNQTWRRVREIELDCDYLDRERKLIDRINFVYSQTRASIEGEYGAFIRFWTRLFMGIPARYINDEGKVGVPYNEFLYDASVLNCRYISRKRGLSIWSHGDFVLFPNRISKLVVNIMALRIILEYLFSEKRKNGTVVGAVTGIFSKTASLIWRRFRPRAFVINSRRWGLGSEKLVEHRLGSDD